MIFFEDVEMQWFPLRWRHNDHDGVSNHQPHGCLLNRLFRRKSKKTSKPRVTGLCAGNSPGTGEFPAQMASYAENVSIWWRHHAITKTLGSLFVDNGTHCSLVNPLRLADAYMCEWTKSLLVQVMAWHQTCAKPLPEPMMTYC